MNNIFDPEFDVLLEDILLEKDHRQKMVKFGIPENVAEFLHSFNDKYSLWFANQIKSMSGYNNAQLKVNWISVNLLPQMQGIIDWVSNVPNISLKTYNWEQAVNASQEYHNNLQHKNLETEETNTIIKKYNDGFYWVDLESRKCEEEADLMGHCGTTTADTIYSLRRYDPHTQTIEGFVSMAISPDEGIWQQCKGKRNSKPKSVYFPYIVDILVENDVFEYKAEYDSGNDFRPEDFIAYLEENPKIYPNSQEIISKIAESTVPIERFQKIIDDANLKFFNIDVYEEFFGDGSTYAYASIYFELDLNYDINRERILGETGALTELELLDICEDWFHFNIEDVDYADYTKTIFIRIGSSDYLFELDDDGLMEFERMIQKYKNEDNEFDRKLFIAELYTQAIAAEAIDDPITSAIDEIAEDDESNLNSLEYGWKDDKLILIAASIDMADAVDRLLDILPEDALMQYIKKENKKGLFLTANPGPAFINTNHPVIYLYEFIQSYARYISDQMGEGISVYGIKFKDSAIDIAIQFDYGLYIEDMYTKDEIIGMLNFIDNSILKFEKTVNLIFKELIKPTYRAGLDEEGSFKYQIKPLPEEWLFTKSLQPEDPRQMKFNYNSYKRPISFREFFMK